MNVEKLRLAFVTDVTEHDAGTKNKHTKSQLYFEYKIHMFVHCKQV